MKQILNIEIAETSKVYGQMLASWAFNGRQHPDQLPGVCIV